MHPRRDGAKCGREHHRRRRIPLAQFARQPYAVTARHLNIAEHDRRLMVLSLCGRMMAGPRMRYALHHLADNFDSVMPRRGVYVPAHAAARRSNP